MEEGVLNYLSLVRQPGVVAQAVLHSLREEQLRVQEQEVVVQAVETLGGLEGMVQMVTLHYSGNWLTFKYIYNVVNIDKIHYLKFMIKENVQR